MLRGTAAGLEFVFGERAFDVASARIVSRLDDRPDFYRGSQAAAIFEGAPPPDELLRAFLQAAQDPVALASEPEIGQPV